jgi:hypothetical protein
MFSLSKKKLFVCRWRGARDVKKVIDYVVNKYYGVVEWKKCTLRVGYLYILPQNPLPPLTVNTPNSIAIPISVGTSGSFFLINYFTNLELCVVNNFNVIGVRHTFTFILSYELALWAFTPQFPLKNYIVVFTYGMLVLACVYNS